MQILDERCYKGKGYRITGFPLIKGQDGEWHQGVRYEATYELPTGVANEFVRLKADFEARFRPIAFTLKAKDG